MSSAANDLAIIEELNKEKMSEKEIGPAISSQLAEVAMKYWSEESKNSVVVTKILNGLKIPANCSGICGPILNEAVAKNRKFMPFHKRADKRLSDIQKRLIFATSAVLEIADELILAHNEIRPPNLGKVMGHTVDFITLMGRAHKQISAERKERLNPVLNGDIRTPCEKKTSDSKYLFGENLLESMKEAKESFSISNSLVNNSSSKLQKVIYQSGSKRSFGYIEKWWCWYQVFCFPFFKLSGPQKEPPPMMTVIQQHQIYHQQKVTQVLRKCASNESIFLFLIGKRSLQTRRCFRLFKG